MTRLYFIRCIGAALLCIVVPTSLHAQVITNFSPKYGSPGDEIVIDGSGFMAGPITVRFWSGVVVTQGFINSDTKITVTSVPAGISTGPISVQLTGGPVNYSPDIFTVVGPGPFIERVDPNYGAVNDNVTIHGVHFVPGSVVKFGAKTASSVPNGAGTSINTTVPAGAVTAPVSVTASGYTYTNAEPFTVVGAGPYLAEFTPHQGSDTQPVTLTGLHFASVNAVRFNGVLAPFDPVTNDKQIKTYAPIGVTTGPISVTTPAGSYTNNALFYGPIRLTSFSPSAGPVGTQVLISGTNFIGATSVKFGGFTGVGASFVVSNNNQLVATVPTNAPTGFIVVANPAGPLSFTNSNFVVTPSITAFTPPSGAPGTPVQINGTRLVDNGGGAPTVKFNGTTAVVNNWGSQQVLVTAPASSSGFITLATTDGTSQTASPFYYPPVITGFSPSTNPPGTVVSITGQSLTNASSVLFNGVPSTNVMVLNNTSLQATVPTGFTTGPLTVTTPGGTTNSTALYYATPLISAFAPDSGGPGTSVTVFGSSFQGTTAVRFNGTNASFNNVMNGQLTAVVPMGASTGPISITAPAGTATSAELFVVPRSADLRTNTFLHNPNPVLVGAELTFTFVPVNQGPDAASNVTASVFLAPGLVVKSASSNTPGVTVNTNGNPVVFSLGTVDIFSNPTLTLVVVPQTPGAVTNTVTFSSSTFDPNLANNTGSRVTTVLPIAELRIGAIGVNQVRVSWPVSLSNFLLQSTAVLTNNPPWANVPGTPAVEGSERVVTQPATGAAKYYRLKQ